VSIGTRTTNYTIVDDLTALLDKPAGCGAPDPKGRIRTSAAKTWPAEFLPANGESSGPGGKPLPCPERKENGVGALNDPYMGARRFPRFPSLPEGEGPAPLSPIGRTFPPHIAAELPGNGSQ